jgi:mannosyltransferase
MTTATPRRPLPWLLQAPEVPDVHAPAWWNRLPVWLSSASVVVVLTAISAYIRTRYIGGQFWSDEAISVGIASHPLSAIPSIVRLNGSAPLYYLLLHVWASLFGLRETAVHAFSLLFGLLSIPLATWVGWSLFGRRAGLAAAVLFAFSPFLTQYAQEAQPYELLALLGLLATGSFLHAFARRRRAFVWLFAVSLALVLYTSFWGIFFWVGTAVALIPLHRGAEDRRGLVRDAVLAYGIGLILFIPWIPNLIFQIGHTTNPWGYGDRPGFGFPSSMLGTDRVSVTLGVAFVIGLVPLLSGRRRLTPEARMVWALIATALVAVLLARLLSLVSPVWETRYLATILASLLLLGALACARAGVIGPTALILTIAFAANSASFAPQNKSDMRDVAAELGPYLRPHDLILVGAPEQAPLAWAYLPSGLRYASPMGPLSDPSYMNWNNAYSRLADAAPVPRFAALMATLRPGQRLLFTRPLTEGVKQWEQPWSRLVRRRAAQWGQLISADRQLRPIAGAVAPHNYRSSCCIADSAVVYQKVGG